MSDLSVPPATSADSSVRLAGQAPAHDAVTLELRALGPDRERLFRDIEERFAAAGAGDLPIPPTRPAVERAAAAWSDAHRLHAQALAELPQVTRETAAAQQDRLLDTYRDLRRREARLDQLIGFDPRPIRLLSADLPDYAMLLAALRDAEAVRDTTPEPAPLEREAAAELSAQHGRFCDQHALGPQQLQPPVPPPAGLATPAPPPGDLVLGSAVLLPADAAIRRAPLERDYQAASHWLRELAPGTAAPADRFAAAFGARARAELGLECLEADLRRAVSYLAAMHDRLAADASAVEARLVAQVPHPHSLHLYEHMLRQLTVTDDGLLATRTVLEAVESSRLARDLGRLERRLETDPAGGHLAEHSRLLERTIELDPRTLWALRPIEVAVARSAHWPAGAAALPATARDLAEIQLASRAATARFADEPSRSSLLGHRAALEHWHRLRLRWQDTASRTELRAARGDLRHLLRQLERQATPAGLPPHLAAPWAAALARYHRAEDDLAAHLAAAERTAPASIRTDRLAALLGRLQQGDASPQTLASLHRETAYRRRFPALPAPRPAPPPADLLSATRGYRAARAALMRAARDAHPGRSRAAAVPREALDRLHEAIIDCQRSAADLGRLAARSPGSVQLLPLDAFLHHPELRATPHRAVAAWSAHAAARGVRPADLPARLARTLGPVAALPRMFSPAFVVTAARAAGRWLGRIAAAVVDQGPDR
jgi:hypothetical protein